MLRFLIGKELTAQLVSSLEKTFNERKGATAQNKSELEGEKLNIERAFTVSLKSI